MSQKTFIANVSDGERILEILESSPGKGMIELLYTRRPNAYVSYHKESNDVSVYAIKENEDIVATGTEIVRDVYINGKIRKIAYLCGLKKDYYTHTNINWSKFVRNLVRKDIDCYFCSIIEENKNAQILFEKKRKRSMNMNYLQTYTTYMLKPYFKFKVEKNDFVFKVEKNDFVFKKVEKNDESQLLNFLNQEGKRKDLFPVFYDLNQFSDISYKDFYILKNNEKIIACGALWNQTSYRQYIVKKYNGIMKLMRAFNCIFNKLNYIKLPNENEMINFPMLSFFISKDDNELYYKVFLNNIVGEIRKNYDMFVIGNMSNSFSNDIYKKLKNISFNSRIYLIDFIIKNGNVQKIDNNNIWLECGLL